MDSAISPSERHLQIALGLQGAVEGGLQASVRGDTIAWLSKAECAKRSGFRELTNHMDEMIAKLVKTIPELHGKMLVRYASMCSCYPGSGAR